MTCPNKHTLVMSADTCPFCEASRLLGENRILVKGLEGIAEYTKSNNSWAIGFGKTAKEILAEAKSTESGDG